MTERPYLSIGEVLGILLEEFPDVTISKIRFLESQGLIDPERTPSGYRKFYDEDVERLRFILREQKERYLPLRVIKDKLGNGEAERTAAPPPRGIRNVTALMESPFDPAVDVDPDPSEVTTADHPSARPARAASPPPPPEPPPAPPAPTRATPRDPTGPLERLQGIDRDELIAMTGLDAEALRELESFGLVNGRRIGDTTLYDATACEIAEVAARFLMLGVEVRHLRIWRTSVDREAALLEQRVMPLLHQRNPQAREQFAQLLDDLVNLGGRLHAALVQSSVAQLIDGR